MTEVKLQNITKNFGLVEVLKEINLSISSGEFCVIVGPSGCGKSTLLRIISGLESANAGQILINETDVSNLPAGERGVAMVFQSYALYPHMTAEQNMSFGLRMTGTPSAQVKERVSRAARILQIETILDRRPKQLSGGEQQRVAIGRAIVREPEVFLFDEPLSNLDAELRVQMRVEIARLHAAIGSTMIFVTHDQVEAMTLADRIVVMNNGMIQQIGKPIELYEKPINQFVAGFLGQPKMNFFEAAVKSREGCRVEILLGVAARPIVLSFAGPLAPGDKLLLGIRPDKIEIVGQEAGEIFGRVEVVEHLGSKSTAYVAINGVAELVTIEIVGKVPLDLGESVGLRLDKGACHLFGVDGAVLPGPIN